ncbi:MOMP family protein [Candidatus Aerophobetes bacterium]|uniref:MOMP family protein n=1 Tax=Aerophobetes bacterium TaxID=2030807 RepID=A0A2A4YCU5_UNCAE|nr:MAG: MOMP family protein [Candidatus Aerophobetes bacterium]
MGYFKYASVSAIAIALSASAFAGPDLDTRVHDLEKQMKQVRTETASTTYGAQTASARPNVTAGGYGFFLTFDVLYFQGRVGGTEYAYTDQDIAGLLPVSGRVKEVDFKWDWGFRAGVGYNFDHGDWDALANYTYFNNNTSSMVTGELNGVVIPLRGTDEITEVNANNVEFSLAQKATVEFKFSFDRIDLELGRNFFVSRNLSFRPHAGLVTAWINLKELVRYTGGTQLDNNTVHVKDRNDFWGIGPRVGANGKWHLTNGFSIMADASGGLVYGHYGVQHKNWFSADPENQRVRLSANMHRFAPTAQIKLGIAYDKYIYNDKQHFSISLCWDTQYWWRVNQMLRAGQEVRGRTIYTRASEDVSLQGVALNVKWNF